MSRARMLDFQTHPRAAPLRIIDTSTSVDCAKDVRLRRPFRSLVDCLMAPYCCGLPLSSSSSPSQFSHLHDHFSFSSSSPQLTGTFFAPRRGRVSFCLQDHPRASPLLLVDLSVPTSFLAREMQQGLLRIALEHTAARRGDPAAEAESLFSVPVWSMFCNGRKVGFAVRRGVGEGDLAMLRTMKPVSVGAGVLPAGGLMYLRARFERVVGSVDTESFHMINPLGCTGQELSIFLSRS